MSETTLDSDELLHLAIEASTRGKHDDSISLLKRVLHIDPQNAKAHYMLGAEQAQIGLYDRAIAEMTAAVALDKNLFTAHLQLALLHLTRGNPDMARQAWQPLTTLAPDVPLRLIKDGLEHLIDDRFTEALETLEGAVRLNTENHALNRDVEAIMKSVRTHLAAEASHREGIKKTDPDHIFLAAYKESNDQTH